MYVITPMPVKLIHHDAKINVHLPNNFQSNDIDNVC